MNTPPRPQRRPQRPDRGSARPGTSQRRTHGLPQARVASGDRTPEATPRPQASAHSRGAQQSRSAHTQADWNAFSPQGQAVHYADDYDADYVDYAGDYQDAPEQGQVSDHARVPRSAARRPADRSGSSGRSGSGVGNWINDLIDNGDVKQWIPIGAAVLLIVGVVGFALSSNGDDLEANAAAPPPTSAAAAVPTSMAAQPIATVATTAPVQKTPLTRTITKGQSGDDVTAIQNRLKELGYDPGPADGIYGQMTISAVWAYKKLEMDIPRDQVTDEVTPEMWDKMQDQTRVAPRRANAGSENHLEIYLPQQVMVLFNGTTPRLIAHISTGELTADGQPAPYCEDIVKDVDNSGVPLDEPIPGESCGVAKTPGGVFKVGRMEQGKHESVLGGMWDPVYFNYMIAIHGALNVPLHPASHGCVRIERHIAEYFQSLVAKGDMVYVWNGTQEPEEVSEEDAKPRWDTFTPDSTVPATAPATVAPSTTTGGTAAPQPNTTVAKPAPSTTQAPAPTTTQAPATSTSTTQAPVTTTTVATDPTTASTTASS